MLLTMGGPVNLRHRKLMEDLASAKPTLPPDVETWGESESAKRILKRIVSSGIQPETAHRGRRKIRTRMMVALGALTLVIVGLGTFLALHFLLGSVPTAVVSQPTTTASPSESEKPATIEYSLEQIIEVAAASSSIAPGQAPPVSGHTPDVLEKALGFGLLLPAESEKLNLQASATRQQFALWLWRGFGAVIPKGSAPVTAPDLGMLSAEERRAVESLIRDGIIIVASGQAFEGNKPMTAAEESALLGRLKALVE
ncbi:MAG: hypothetical protein M1274_01710 [Actinobacteria bacterium]|nr:hypothetical protein [Actinomycetota bacterium]